MPISLSSSDQLEGKLDGIEPGSGANGTISKMISDNTFGLSGFKLVESSEQAMLSETAHRIKEGKPVVFFGWQPHPMNVNLPMVYLTKGNDNAFSVRTRCGGATVVTLTRAGYARECPNVERLLLRISPSIPRDRKSPDERHPGSGHAARRRRARLDEKQTPPRSPSGWMA